MHLVKEIDLTRLAPNAPLKSQIRHVWLQTGQKERRSPVQALSAFDAEAVAAKVVMAA
jgi:hypothetical protein